MAGRRVFLTCGAKIGCCPPGGRAAGSDCPSIARPVSPPARNGRNGALSLSADGRLSGVGGLSPAGCGVATIRASAAATGRGWRHPSPTGSRPGAWKESEMARAPGGSLRRLARGASNGAQAASSSPPSVSGADRRPSESGPRPQRDGKSPARGCRTATRWAGNRPWRAHGLSRLRK